MIDWRNMHNELFRDGNWCLINDWTMRPKVDVEWESVDHVAIVHCCYGEEWMVRAGTRAMRNNRCINCHAPIPLKLLGLQALANWDR
jgi:hypothetical protein